MGMKDLIGLGKHFGRKDLIGHFGRGNHMEMKTFGEENIWGGKHLGRKTFGEEKLGRKTFRGGKHLG